MNKHIKEKKLSAEVKFIDIYKMDEFFYSILRRTPAGTWTRDAAAN
jgi:hypothetical protein